MFGYYPILVKSTRVFFNLQGVMIRYISQKDKYTNIVENRLQVKEALGMTS